MMEDLMILFLRFYSFKISRLEKASDHQLALAVNEGVCHVLLSRKTVWSLQWLDAETSQRLVVHLSRRPRTGLYVLSDNICMMPASLYTVALKTSVEV